MLSSNFKDVSDAIINLRTSLQKVMGETMPDVAEGLVEIGQDVFDESQMLVPVDRGWLKDSGHIGEPIYQQRSVRLNISYGGGVVDYALYVHEDVLAHHPHGQAKFLEEPLLKAIFGFGERLSAKWTRGLARELRPQRAGR